MSGPRKRSQEPLIHAPIDNQTYISALPSWDGTGLNGSDAQPDVLAGEEGDAFVQLQGSF
jgi:hypothetical protein